MSSGAGTTSRRGPAPATPPPRRASRTRTAEVDDAVEVRPRRPRTWWVLGAVTLLVVLAGGAAYSPLLDVESVEVAGVTPDRVAAVKDASGVEVGDSIVTFLPGSVAGRVERLPWVAEARVSRDLPDAVRIEVVPRVPVGWTRAGTGLLVVDAESRVLWKADAPPSGVPELVGVADLAPVGGRIAPASLAEAAGALGQELRLRIAAVELVDGAVTGQVAGGPQLRFGAPRGMATKARVVSAVLASLGAAPVTYVDVSVPAAPVSG